MLDLERTRRLLNQVSEKFCVIDTTGFATVVTSCGHAQADAGVYFYPHPHGARWWSKGVNNVVLAHKAAVAVIVTPETMSNGENAMMTLNACGNPGPIIAVCVSPDGAHVADSDMLEIQGKLIKLGADYAFWPHTFGPSLLYELEKGIQVTRRCVDRLHEEYVAKMAERSKHRHLLFEVLPQETQVAPHIPKLNDQWTVDRENAIFTNMKFGRQLGRGAFGVVFECQSPQSMVFAVKEYRKTSDWDLHRLKTVNREISILRQLRGHPNVVNIAGVKHTKKGIYMAMEMAGERSLLKELKDAFSNGLPNWSMAKAIYMQILSALRHAHELGVVHHDLKPANIILKGSLTSPGVSDTYYHAGDVPGNGLTQTPLTHQQPEPEVVLVDFGLAEREERTSGDPCMKSVSVCGTYPYIPPEAIRLLHENQEARYYDGRKADIWAIGVTLLDMLCGVGTFQGEVLKVFPLDTFPSYDLNTWSLETAYVVALSLENAARPQHKESVLSRAEEDPARGTAEGPAEPGRDGGRLKGQLGRDGTGDG